MNEYPMAMQNPDRHGDPEGNFPPDHHQGDGVGTDAHILSLAQLHLATVTSDRIPSHPEKGEEKEVDRDGLDVGSSPKPGEEDQKKGEESEPYSFWPGKVPEVEGIL